MNENDLQNKLLDVITFRGLNGYLNLSIDTNGINDEDLFLLQKCKQYIEEDLFAPSQHHQHLSLDNAENCIKRLLNSNNKKSEYHHLYGMIIENKCLQKHKGRYLSPGLSQLLAKQHLIAYDLNPDHPSHFLAFHDTNVWFDGDPMTISIWYAEFEMKLHDEAYRNKYSSIIQEIECEFINTYCLFLYNESFDITDTYYYTLESYFDRYCLILKHLNLCTKQNNFYVFTQNHLIYCSQFAKKFCRYRKYKKALKSMNLFVDNFDKRYHYLTTVSDPNECRDGNECRLIIDILLAMGKYYTAVVFIEDCIGILINYFEDGEYRSELLYLTSTLTRICCDCSWGVEEQTNDKYFKLIATTAREQTEGLIMIKNLWPRDTLFYYSSICVMYSKIMNSRHIKQEVIEQYAQKIENIIGKNICKNMIYSYFAESCFMLGVIYQNFLNRVNSASVLYFTSILHLSEHIHTGRKSNGHNASSTKILSY
eukprot:262679_1